MRRPRYIVKNNNNYYYIILMRKPATALFHNNLFGRFGRILSRSICKILIYFVFN